MTTGEPLQLDVPLDPPGPKSALRAADVRIALTMAGGVDLQAARLLNCSPERVRRMRQRRSTVQAAADQARLNIRDEAEIQLLKAIRSGVLTALTFYLKLEPAPDISRAELLAPNMPSNGR